MRPFEPSDPLTPDGPNADAEDCVTRLATIRSMIDDGTYDTPERLDAALSLLLVEIGES